LAASLLAAFWFLFTRDHSTDLFLPSPESVWQALVTVRGRLFVDSAITFVRVLAGWTVGTILGIQTGISMAKSRKVHGIANPIIEILRPLPPVALIPFFILWFGTNPGGQIGLIALGCFMVMVVNTYVSARNVPNLFVRAALCLGVTRKEVYRTVIFPAIFPELVSGFRIAAALAFGVGVAAEFMGAQSGLGFLIMVARRTLNTNTILLGTVIIGIESYAFDLVLRAFSSMFLKWKYDTLGELRGIRLEQLREEIHA
jgi:ABC-type nitrate/sulfonate/bicarbonate transport system permease component